MQKTRSQSYAHHRSGESRMFIGNQPNKRRKLSGNALRSNKELSYSRRRDSLCSRFRFHSRRSCRAKNQAHRRATRTPSQTHQRHCVNPRPNQAYRPAIDNLCTRNRERRSKCPAQTRKEKRRFCGAELNTKSRHNIQIGRQQNNHHLKKRKEKL